MKTQQEHEDFFAQLRHNAAEYYAGDVGDFNVHNIYEALELAVEVFDVNSIKIILANRDVENLNVTHAYACAMVDEQDEHNPDRAEMCKLLLDDTRCVPTDYHLEMALTYKMVEQARQMVACDRFLWDNIETVLYSVVIELEGVLKGNDYDEDTKAAALAVMQTIVAQPVVKEIMGRNDEIAEKIAHIDK